MDDEALHYLVEHNPDLKDNESVVYLYWNGMAAGFRFSSVADLLEFIHRAPEFLAAASEDLQEKMIAREVAQMDKELPNLFKDNKKKGKE